MNASAGSKYSYLPNLRQHDECGYIPGLGFSKTGLEQGMSMTQHQLFVSAFFVVLLMLLYQMAIILAPFLVLSSRPEMRDPSSSPKKAYF